MLAASQSQMMRNARSLLRALFVFMIATSVFPSCPDLIRASVLGRRWIAGSSPAMTFELQSRSPSPLTGCLPFLLTRDSLREEKALRRNDKPLACVLRASPINSPATLMGY
jgi:hypothetical protein